MAYDDQNIFAKIVRGEMSAYTVYETDDCLSFMDVMPQSDGHTLVLPKVPAENIYDLDAASAAALIQCVQHVARGVRDAFEPDGVRIMQYNGSAAGQSVFHLHFHVVPCYAGKPLGRHGGGMEEEEILEQNAARLRAALEKI